MEQITPVQGQVAECCSIACQLNCTCRGQLVGKSELRECLSLRQFTFAALQVLSGPRGKLIWSATLPGVAVAASLGLPSEGGSSILVAHSQAG